MESTQSYLDANINFLTFLTSQKEEITSKITKFNQLTNTGDIEGSKNFGKELKAYFVDQAT